MLIEKTFDTGAVTINYAEGPAAGPPLILLHGAFLNWHNFEPLIPELTKRWHVYACDGRGHGKSGRVPRDYRGVDFISDAVSFIQRQIAQPSIVIGHSMGGIEALGVAATIPERVRAAVLIDPAIAMREISVQEVMPAISDWAAAIRQILKSERTTEEVLNDLNPGIDEASMRSLDAMIRGIDLDFIDVLMDRDQFVTGLDWNVMLQQVACSTLLLYGELEAGAIVRESDLDFVRTNAPHVVAVQIKGAGHLLHVEQPAQVLEQVTQFLNALQVE